MKTADPVKAAIVERIISAFGSQKKLAEKLHISEAAISKHLDRLNPKFLEKLKRLGIEVEKVEPATGRRSGEIEGRFVDKLIDNYEIRIHNLEDENEELKKEVEKLKAKLVRLKSN